MATKKTPVPSREGIARRRSVSVPAKKTRTSRKSYATWNGSWVAREFQAALTNLDKMARFQQKQLQEKEQKLLQLYDQQQQRAYQVVQKGSAGSNGSSNNNNGHHAVSHQTLTRASSHTTSGSQAVKTRQQTHEERRQTSVKGIDRSYPLEPLYNKARKQPVENGAPGSNNFAEITHESSAPRRDNDDEEDEQVEKDNEQVKRQDAEYEADFRNENHSTRYVNGSHRDENEVRVEATLDEDTIQRNRMMAKLHLMEYDESMKHRVRYDLESEEFPEDLMVNVPDRLPKQNATKKLSQAEARLERFKNANAKRNSLAKNTNPTSTVIKRRSEPILPARTSTRVELEEGRGIKKTRSRPDRRARESLEDEGAKLRENHGRNRGANTEKMKESKAFRDAANVRVVSSSRRVSEFKDSTVWKDGRQETRRDKSGSTVQAERSKRSIAPSSIDSKTSRASSSPGEIKGSTVLGVKSHEIDSKSTQISIDTITYPQYYFTHSEKSGIIELAGRSKRSITPSSEHSRASRASPEPTGPVSKKLSREATGELKDSTLLGVKSHEIDSKSTQISVDTAMHPQYYCTLSEKSGTTRLAERSKRSITPSSVDSKASRASPEPTDRAAKKLPRKEKEHFEDTAVWKTESQDLGSKVRYLCTRSEKSGTVVLRGRSRRSVTPSSVESSRASPDSTYRASKAELRRPKAKDLFPTASESARIKGIVDETSRPIPPDPKKPTDEGSEDVARPSSSEFEKEWRSSAIPKNFRAESGRSDAMTSLRQSANRTTRDYVNKETKNVRSKRRDLERVQKSPENKVSDLLESETKRGGARVREKLQKDSFNTLRSIGLIRDAMRAQNSKRERGEPKNLYDGSYDSQRAKRSPSLSRRAPDRSSSPEKSNDRPRTPRDFASRRSSIEGSKKVDDRSDSWISDGIAAKSSQILSKDRGSSMSGKSVEIATRKFSVTDDEPGEVESVGRPTISPNSPKSVVSMEVDTEIQEITMHDQIVRREDGAFACSTPVEKGTPQTKLDVDQGTDELDQIRESRDRGSNHGRNRPKLDPRCSGGEEEKLVRAKVRSTSSPVDPAASPFVPKVARMEKDGKRRMGSETREKKRARRNESESSGLEANKVVISLSSKRKIVAESTTKSPCLESSSLKSSSIVRKSQSKDAEKRSKDVTKPRAVKKQFSQRNVESGEKIGERSIEKIVEKELASRDWVRKAQNRGKREKKEDKLDRSIEAPLKPVESLKSYQLVRKIVLDSARDDLDQSVTLKKIGAETLGNQAEDVRRESASSSRDLRQSLESRIKGIRGESSSSSCDLRQNLKSRSEDARGKGTWSPSDFERNSKSKASEDSHPSIGQVETTVVMAETSLDRLKKSVERTVESSNATKESKDVGRGSRTSRVDKDESSSKSDKTRRMTTRRLSDFEEKSNSRSSEDSHSFIGQNETMVAVAKTSLDQLKETVKRTVESSNATKESKDVERGSRTSRVDKDESSSKSNKTRRTMKRKIFDGSLAGDASACKSLMRKSREEDKENRQTRLRTTSKNIGATLKSKTVDVDSFRGSKDSHTSKARVSIESRTKSKTNSENSEKRLGPSKERTTNWKKQSDSTKSIPTEKKKETPKRDFGRTDSVESALRRFDSIDVDYRIETRHETSSISEKDKSRYLRSSSKKDKDKEANRVESKVDIEAGKGVEIEKEKRQLKGIDRTGAKGRRRIAEARDSIEIVRSLVSSRSPLCKRKLFDDLDVTQVESKNESVSSKEGSILRGTEREASLAGSLSKLPSLSIKRLRSIEDIRRSIVASDHVTSPDARSLVDSRQGSESRLAIARKIVERSGSEKQSRKADSSGERTRDPTALANTPKTSKNGWRVDRNTTSPSPYSTAKRISANTRNNNVSPSPSKSPDNIVVARRASNDFKHQESKQLRKLSHPKLSKSTTDGRSTAKATELRNGEIFENGHARREKESTTTTTAMLTTTTATTTTTSMKKGDSFVIDFNEQSSKKQQATSTTATRTAPSISSVSSIGSTQGQASTFKGRMSTRAKVPPVATPVATAKGSTTSSKSLASPCPNDNLIACKICGRRFAQDRVNLHEQICSKSTQKKRKKFDAMMYRVRGTDLEPFVKKSIGKKSEVKLKKPEVKSNWRRKHEDFINAIRSAKQVQAHLAAGGRLSDLPPPPASDTSDYVQCPHCARRFNQAAAERHIPKCEHMLHNKPATRVPPKPRR